MKYIITLLILFLALHWAILSAQGGMVNVYFLPGTGSDERLFSKIILPEGFTANHVQYPVPDKKATMSEYAAIIAQQIDTTQRFVLVGVSIGGMICTELADLIKPEKTIVISSSKCRQELPRHYRFQKHIPLNKLFGARLIKAMSFAAQAIVEPDRNQQKAVFKAMLRDKNRLFLKRAVNMIINWEREGYSPHIVHIHGTKDHTLPLKNINPSIIIQAGSHMMTLTRGEEINAIIQRVLMEK